MAKEEPVNGELIAISSNKILCNLSWTIFSLVTLDVNKSFSFCFEYFVINLFWIFCMNLLHTDNGILINITLLKIALSKWNYNDIVLKFWMLYLKRIEKCYILTTNK